jgi:flagellar basal-body rod protein FlgB
VDGNTVDTQVEQAEFAENAVRYQSTLTFLNGKFKGLKLAIKGE